MRLLPCLSAPTGLVTELFPSKPLLFATFVRIIRVYSTRTDPSSYLTPVLKSVGVTNASQIAGINGGLAAWNLVLALLAGFNVERVGRRPIFFISFIGMFFSYVFVMGLSAGFAKTGHSAIGVAVIPFLFIYCERQI